MLNFVRNYQSDFRWLCHVTFPPAMNECARCFTSSPAFGGVSVLDFGHSNSVQCYLTVGSICVSLMTYNVEPLFIHLLALCISSLLRCLFRYLSIFLSSPKDIFVFVFQRETKGRGEREGGEKRREREKNTDWLPSCTSSDQVSNLQPGHVL